MSLKVLFLFIFLQCLTCLPTVLYSQVYQSYPKLSQVTNKSRQLGYPHLLYSWLQAVVLLENLNRIQNFQEEIQVIPVENIG